ncbi:hypothetical protein NC653_001780 [Populus alba x Populus x berolinensis]|uniref:Uncharacterized protein n=1 Tax=Populus alba x Populus x berolinensis TaxID=444605 RepID=A0AAD6RM23_9ROSI|nr:hypothetical protein NC653_001780 [Populus alba x Populus x berolinensis]
MISLPWRTHYSAPSKFIELVHYNLCSPVSSPPEYLPDDDSLHLASLKVDMTLEIHHNMTNILA